MSVRSPPGGRWPYFLLTGCLAAGVHLTVVFLVVRFAGLHPAIANVFAFMCAFTVSFVGHVRYTFALQQWRFRHVRRWLQVSIPAFAANQMLYVIGLRFLPETSYLILLFLITLGIAVVTYFLGKYWAFLSG